MVARAEPFALLATLFRGLADPARLSCLLAVRDHPSTVGEIVRWTGLHQSNVSKHLAYLRYCGLVQARRSGRFVFYSLGASGVEGLLRAAETLLAQAESRGAACRPPGRHDLH